MSLRRALFVVPTLSALLLVGGCVKFGQRLFLLPDGSGKLVLVYGRDPKLSEDDPLAGLDHPRSVDEMLVGYSAVAAKHWTKDGWDYREVTIYFDDINEFKVRYTSMIEVPGEGGEGETVFEFVPRTQLEFRFEPTGGAGHRLTVTNATGTMFGEVVGDDGAGLSDDEKTRSDAEMAKSFKGFGLRESYVLPGAVVSSEGLPKREGRTATFELGADEVNAVSKWKKFFGPRTQRVVCGASTMKEAEIAEFREEAAKAKAEWEKRRAAAKEEERVRGRVK